ncbi:DNA-binding protein HU-beta [mine drainage metagenome]|uniref:DNA-binding protein HU-beta n=1 Tax=mine drainage metagenome TaxID=410659 RepID=A0A1J5R068_9ZZZZ
MNKTEMVAELERRLGSHGAAVSALDAVLGAVQEAVAAGDRVTLTGFGTFERVTRPARTGRHPRTGAPIAIAASSLPRFRAGAALRAAVAGATPTRSEARVTASVAAPSMPTAPTVSTMKASGTKASGTKASGTKASGKRSSGKKSGTKASSKKASGKKASGKGR